MNIYRGDIYYIENSKYFSVEYQSGTGARPAIIVSNDACNQNSDECSVVYLTRTDDAPHIPTHVPVLCKVPSVAKCETVCRINQNRIGEFVRACTDAEMQAIDKALMIQLGLGLEMPADPKKDAEIERLKAELEKRNQAYEELDVKHEALEAEYRKMSEELENAKIALSSAVETNSLQLQERDDLLAELNAEKAVSDRYAQEIVSIQAQRNDLECKLDKYRTMENAKIKELDALLEAEKATSGAYKRQRDEAVEAKAKLLVELKEAEETMAEMVEAEGSSEATIKAQAERDVYKQLYENMLARVLKED